MKILDACCGSKMFWFDKNNQETTYMDIRKEKIDVYGKHVNVDPDIQADFRNMPFSDNSFDLIVFDPPHLFHVGKDSVMKKTVRSVKFRNVERRYCKRHERVHESIEGYRHLDIQVE